MTTKLTLRLDGALIKQAKKTAQSKGVSLSRIVEDYFRSLTIQEKEVMKESPILSEISGVLSDKAGAKKPREVYRKHLEEKYH